MEYVCRGEIPVVEYGLYVRKERCENLKWVADSVNY